MAMAESTVEYQTHLDCSTFSFLSGEQYSLFQISSASLKITGLSDDSRGPLGHGQMKEASAFFCFFLVSVQIVEGCLAVGLQKTVLQPSARCFVPTYLTEYGINSEGYRVCEFALLRTFAAHA